MSVSSISVTGTAVSKAVEPLLFVVGAYVERGGGFLGCQGVQVGHVVADIEGLRVGLAQPARVGVQEGRVGLEVDEAAGRQDMPVQLEETSRGQALALFLHLRVGEGNPYLGHLAGREERLEQFDGRAQEGDVLQPEFLCPRSACPHAGTLDVDADVVAAGVAHGKVDGVFALAAAQLEHDGVVVVEKVSVPVAAQGKSLLAEHGEGILEHEGNFLHVGEFCEFVLCHGIMRLLGKGGVPKCPL